MDNLLRLYQEIGDGKSKGILEAIMNNDCKYVIDYYKAGFDMKKLDDKRETFLHKAARNDHFEMVDLLIKFGSELNARNNYWETPLHLAASRGKESILHKLIAYKAKINIADENGAKPIHHGVASGKEDIISDLLNNGNSLVECDDRKNNVLHYACEAGNDKLTGYILRHMTVNNNRNIYKETALHLAAANCTVNTLKELLNRGYDPDAINIYKQKPYDVAVSKNNIDNAEFLKNYYQSGEYKERFEKYPLHRAICASNYPLFSQILNKKNAHQTDYFGKSPLYYAIIIGSVQMVRELCQKGAKIDVVDSFNQPALLIAIYNEDYDTIEYLVKQKANVNEIFYGRSYLYRAILRNNYKIAKLLIEAGADVNYIDKRHRTIYSYALDYADDDIIELLVEKKASII